MATKIFPFRRYNPDKGRALTGLPDQPHSNAEEQRIMRELLAEQTEQTLAKRAAALPPAPAKVAPIPVFVWGYEPEYVLAYESLPRRNKRAGPLADRRAMEAASGFLRRFRKGEQFACTICKADITSADPGGERVPYGVFVWEQRGNIHASGLCGLCSVRAIGVDPIGETESGQPCVITVVEWMSTAEIKDKTDKNWLLRENE
jgi:hypothetical protein